MVQEIKDLSRLPLLIVSPKSTEFQTAVECWNSYLDELKNYQCHPVDWKLSVRNLYREVVELDPHRSKVFTDGIVESTFLAAHDGNGYYPLRTRALIDHNLLVVAGPTFSGLNVDRVRTLIKEQFDLSPINFLS